MVILLQRGRCQQEACNGFSDYLLPCKEVLDTRVFPIYALPCQCLYEKVISSHDSPSCQFKEGMRLLVLSLVYNDKRLIPMISHAREEALDVVEEKFGCGC